MKKILLYTFAVAFVLTLGAAYAVADNGVTDFKGLTYDIGPAGIPAAPMEEVSAGGMREDEGLLLANGITDFSGKTYELWDVSVTPLLPIEAAAVIEGEHAGGMRDASDLINGVTVFSGYDSN